MPSIPAGKTYIFVSAFILCLVSRSQAAEVSFSRQIQPILAEHCLECHGNDASRREADLRLDVEASAVGQAIEPHQPDASLLMERIVATDPDERMPPGDAKQLDAEEISLLRRWIAEGAKYERHWAYNPIKAAQPPSVGESQTDNRSLNLSDIDQFIVAQLRAKSLELSPPATKQQWIRRATFDLVGLPPTGEEVDAFLQDDSPQAYAKVIDRLLDSPAYGERWGRHWLDLARYADTHGGAAIGFTRFPFSYTYRDYVIRAFNHDLPYDQFVMEQLAADQLGLPEDAPQLAALAFLTIGQQFRNPHNIIDDQIDVITRGLMGLTVTCARCHDHKFDAISTKDYYALYATLASSKKPEELPVIGAPQKQDQQTHYEQELQRLQISYGDMAREQSEVMRGRLCMQVGLYLREIANDAPEPDLVSADVFSYRTDDLRHHVIHRWQKYLHAMPEDDAVFGPWVQLKRLADQAAENATNGAPPNVVTSDKPSPAENVATAASTSAPVDDGSTSTFAQGCLALVERLESENGKSSDLQRLSTNAPRWNPRVLATLKSAQPQSLLEVADAYGSLFGQVHLEWLRGLTETATEATPGNAPVPDEDQKHLAVNSAVNRQLRRHLYGPDAPTNVPEPLASRILNRPINDNLNGRRSAIHNLNLNAPGSPPRAMALAELIEPDAFHVFLRGDPRQRGETVEARFLTVLGGSERNRFTPGKRRLELAKAIVDPHNPLTRRVIVNWVWQHHFGKGLVRTPDDLGTRGEPPTHPELLDYLANQLLEKRWSLKQLHRQIMLTRVYQQASIERPAARIVDPNNELLWRMPRQRLSLEAMRDAMLAASGELKPDVGGRPFDLLSSPIVPRRSVYAFVNRDVVAPLMSTFDAANPSACTAKRSETTVPQQTLFALNSDFIQDRAAAMVTAVQSSKPPVGDTKDGAANGAASPNNVRHVRELYRRTFSREPDQQELDAAIGFVEGAMSGEDRLARWRQLAHVLLAANEFVFVD